MIKQQFLICIYANQNRYVVLSMKLTHIEVIYFITLIYIPLHFQTAKATDSPFCSSRSYKMKRIR